MCSAARPALLRGKLSGIAGMANRDVIMEAVRLSGRPLDDDELSRLTGIRPRQTVNRICRDLESRGWLRRVSGPHGKVVNIVTSAGSHSTPPARERAERRGVGDPVPTGTAVGSAAHQGDSAAQRAAERVLLDLLGERLGLHLEPRRLTHPSGARVEIDGVDPNLTVLVECWAHQGPAKVAQKYKLVNDATKLSWIARSLRPRTERLILCVSDEAAVHHLRGTSWQGRAIEEMDVRIEVVELPSSVKAAISAAQARQSR